MKDAWDDLRLAPLRAVLTALSLFLGILAIVTIVAGGAVARDYLLAVAEQRDGRAPTYGITLDLDDGTPIAAVSHLLERLPQTDARAISAKLALADPLLLAPLPDAGMTLQKSTVQSEVVAGDLDRVRRLPLVDGRWLSPDDQDTPYEVVVNERAARTLGDVGTLVSLTGAMDAAGSTAVIVGVVADGDDSQSNAFVKASPLLQHAPQLVRPTSIQLLWHNQGDPVDSAVGDLAVDADLPAPESAHRVDTVETYLEPIAAVQTMFAVAAGLALVVAALGILNVGLSSIRERSRELVIRRAIGATRSQVFRLVMGSSVLVALIVAAAAIVLSAVLVAAVPQFLPANSPVEPPSYPWSAAVWGLVVALATAVVSSAVPAWRAATMEPATALRD